MNKGKTAGGPIGGSIKTYDAYKDSGVEWLGEIPSHWEINHLKSITSILTCGVASTPQYVEANVGVPFLSAQNVKPNRLDLSRYNYIPVALHRQLTRYRTPQRNDVLVTRVGAGIGDACIVDTDLEFSVYVSLTHIRTLDQRLVPSFLVYFFCTTYSKALNKSSVPGGGGQGNLNVKNINKYLVPLPPLDEQEAISAYLDEKTAVIDKKVALLEKKAEHYKSLKQSIINETVTRGLDKSAPLKESGINWIGQIPEHWDIMRVKDSTYVKGRIGWQGLRSEDFLPVGDYYCVTGTDIKKSILDWGSCYFVDKDRYDQDRYIQLKLGDILITKDGTIGKVAIVDALPKPATLNSGVFVTRPINESYVTRFFFWVLHSGQFSSYVDLTKGGSTIQHLYQNVFDRFAFASPSLSEQQKIADYLDEKTAQIDGIIASIARQVSTLKEFRKTLINDVVTGKIKVVE